MVSITSLLASFLVVAGVAIAKPDPKLASQPVLTYVGSQGTVYTDGAWTNKGHTIHSGTVGDFNGSIVAGIGAQTAQTLKNIAAILEEAGTSWDYALKTTVYLANISDYKAMNDVYGAMLPNPKPARTTFQAGHLAGDYLIEIDAVVAIPDSS